MLDRRQRLQRCLPVGTSGAETGGLGTGGGLWTFPAGTLIPAPVPVVAITTTPAATSIVAISTAAASAAPSTSVVTVAASTTTLGRKHLGDQWFFAAAPEQCKGLGLLAGRLRRKDRGDGQAVEISVGLDLQHVTNGSARGEQTSVECALGLLGSSRAPVPLAIATVGCEFDVKPAATEETVSPRRASGDPLQERSGDVETGAEVARINISATDDDGDPFVWRWHVGASSERGDRGGSSGFDGELHLRPQRSTGGHGGLVVHQDWVSSSRKKVPGSVPICLAPNAPAATPAGRRWSARRRVSGMEAVARLGLHRDDGDAGQCEPDPSSQPTTANRHDDGVQVGNLFGKFDAQRALAGHREWCIVGMNVQRPGLGRPHIAGRLRIVVQVADDIDRCTLGAQPFDLGRSRHAGHKDLGRNAQDPPSSGDCDAMIPAGSGDEARLGHVNRECAVQAASSLEGPCMLQTFELEHDRPRNAKISGVVVTTGVRRIKGRQRAARAQHRPVSAP